MNRFINRDWTRTEHDDYLLNVGNNILAESSSRTNHVGDVDAEFISQCFRIPHDAPPRWLLMFTAYLDESGREDNNQRMVMAGFMGNDKQWEECRGRWRTAISPREHLHTKELRFKHDRDRRLLERAGKVPWDCGLTPLFSSIRYSDYKDLVPAIHAGTVFPAYIVCLMVLVIQALKAIPENERLEIVFEDQTTYSSKRDAIMRGILLADNPELYDSKGKPRLANWRTVPKRSTSLTEPVDYLAYSMLQQFRDDKSIKARWCRPILPKDGLAVGMQPDRKFMQELITNTLAAVCEGILGV